MTTNLSPENRRTLERVFGWPPHAENFWELSDEEVDRLMNAVREESEAQRDTLQAENVRLREIADLAAELISPAGMVNRGVDRGLVVVERKDRSDPHYRLCLALEARAALNQKEG